ncbi:MAG: polysulfide reductase NrfD [Clostridia bacterium]|nr:polysulfide reductase NrfD [Clostridia bacterium]
MNNIPLVNDEFVMGFRKQTEWAWLIATAFLLGKIGGGMFLVAMFLDNPLGGLWGLLVVAVGKSAAHLMYLGRPERFWRVLMRPHSSWISRGIWSMISFIVFGLLYLAPSFSWLSWLSVGTDGVLFQIIMVLAALAALLVMVYDGFVMNSSPAISLWNSALLPILCLFYSLLAGISINLYFIGLTGKATTTGLAMIKNLEIGFIALNFIIVVTYILSMVNANVASKESIRLLLKGPYSIAFFGGVILVGFVLTLMFSLFLMGGISLGLLLGLVAADLIGHFFIFFLLLRVGVYCPILGKLSY